MLCTGAVASRRRQSSSGFCVSRRACVKLCYLFLINTGPDGIVWDSLAQSRMREGTASHAELVNRLDALVDDPSSKRDYHIHFSQHPPLACIEAPVTMVAVAELRDIQYLDMWNRLGLSVVTNFKAASAEGYVDSAWANPLEDVQTFVVMSGWDSIEVCVLIARLLWHPSDKLAGVL